MPHKTGKCQSKQSDGTGADRTRTKPIVGRQHTMGDIQITNVRNTEGVQENELTTSSHAHLSFFTRNSFCSISLQPATCDLLTVLFCSSSPPGCHAVHLHCSTSYRWGKARIWWYLMSVFPHIQERTENSHLPFKLCQSLGFERWVCKGGLKA